MGESLQSLVRICLALAQSFKEKSVIKNSQLKLPNVIGLTHGRNTLGNSGHTMHVHSVFLGAKNAVCPELPDVFAEV